MNNVRDYPKQLKDMDDRLKKVENITGGGDNGGMDTAWQNSVNSRLDRVDGDLRQLLWAVIGAVVIMAGMVITSHLLLDGSIKESTKSVNQLTVAIEVLKAKPQ